MAMQPDEVLKTWFEEVWNQGKDATIDRLTAPDGLVHGLPVAEERGPAIFRPIYKRFKGAFPDIHIEVTKTITEGVAVLCHVTGTHTGDALGFPPTGKRVDFYGMTMARVVSGQTHEEWNAFDSLTMDQQLGVVPPTPGV